MAKSPAKAVKATIQSRRTWVDKNYDFVHGRGRRSLEEGFESGDFYGILDVSDSLRRLATSYANRGLVEILDGNPAAWAEIHKAVTYRYWFLKIRLKACLFGSPGGPEGKDAVTLGNDIPRAGCLLCYSIVTANQEIRSCAKDALLTMEIVPGAVNEELWRMRVFEPFALQLLKRLEAFELPQPLQDRDLGVYGSVFENWETTDALASSISDICDYHCRNLEDTYGDWDPEFDESPFDLVPWEVLAIQVVREKSGLTTPTVDHPLLATPLCAVKPPDKPYMDETLERVSEMFDSVFAD